MFKFINVTGGISEKVLKVSKDVVHIIEQLQSNHEEADTLNCFMLLTRPDKAQKGSL